MFCLNPDSNAQIVFAFVRGILFPQVKIAFANYFLLRKN
ncbi:hypothetical protein ADIS_0052 [Lunatimonas lonarensis]|uniref:Uncharacterized protein n=1 Tax=Lunatimonas lonarensis TaxID=1232681 RepID=R7ZZH2_9BACT|nr:hypothetical protein ADIS_0052 [Lunatimonas lonarensis]